MDPSSSGEELIIKTRKPYTIRKRRERWTEEEHNRFVEAIKLYGRAWQRIEEHIGTKTAVQIRSHAQKFFSKLEKEALIKGVPVRQALDIDIPPPRPKRKPSNPYPRKSSVVIPASQVGEKDGKGLISTPPHFKEVLDLVKEPFQERSNEDRRSENSNKNQEDKSSEVSKKFQKHQCCAASSANVKFARAHVGLKGPCIIKESMPSVKEDNGTNEVPHLEISKPLDVKSDGDKKGKDSTAALTTYEILVSTNAPRHVPVHVVDKSIHTCTGSPTADISFQDPSFQPVGVGHDCPNLLGNPAASTNNEHPNDASQPIHHSWSVPSPFIKAHHNQDDHRKFLQTSSMFATLIMSTLLQNPAAHAAASFAASFWPHASLEHSSGSPGCTQCGHVPSLIESPPSAASIVAATVASATAWWAAQGLLPLYSPLQPAFARSPAPATAGAPVNTDQASSSKTQRVDNTSQKPTLQDQQLNPENSEALQAQFLASKSNIISSTDSEDSGATKLNGRDSVLLEKDVVATELPISDKTKVGKQIEPTSSGSNTPSSSEVEADAQKNYKTGKDNSMEPKDDSTYGELGNRCRGMANMSESRKESRKEVSEEGKLAFQVLFSREVLPQSFSSALAQQNEGLVDNTNNDTQKAGKTYGDAKLLDLSRKSCGLPDSNQAGEKDTEHDDDNGEGGLLTIGLENGRLRTSWTGFKPYKRCSVEAKENMTKVRSTKGVEKGPKRTRLEGEAST